MGRIMSQAGQRSSTVTESHIHPLTKALAPFIDEMESRISVRMVAVMVQAAYAPLVKRRVSAIASDLNISIGAVSVIVTRLVKLGLVKERNKLVRTSQGELRRAGSGEPIALTITGLALLNGY